MSAAPMMSADDTLSPYASGPMLDDGAYTDAWHGAMGQELQFHRKRLKMTQEQAKSVTGVSASMMSKIERGEGTTFERYLLIARAYDLNFTDLITAAELHVQARIVMTDSLK